MDPMDYSMDDANAAQPSSSSAPRCQYHAQQPAGDAFASPSRDAHHYDPIHNTESWLQLDGSIGPHPARVLPSFAQWNQGQFVSSHAWQPLGDGHARLRGDLPDPAHANGFMGVPNPAWNEMTGYDSLPPIMSLHSRGTATAITSSTRNVAPTSIPSSIAPPIVSSNASPPQLAYPRNSRPEPPAQIPPSPEGRPNLMERSRAARLARAERREALQSQLAQSFEALDHPRSTPEDRFARRRAAPTWESDDEEDSLADSEDAGYRRHSQLFGDHDEERALAAIRGTIAAAKKVPSKETLASLERVDLKDLKDSDRVCTICYNDIGVENPDGVIENPIRLPRCKHIFGEKCIKKWFQDSDTCPYCRDKLPSELSVRKTAAFESLRAHRERLAAITAQAYRTRQQGFPPRYPSNEELAAQERNNVIRYTQEEYHYIMTGNHSAESWSYIAHNRPPHRESPEARRRQGRGRASLSRPISVGSARLVAPGPPIMNHQGTPQRPHLGMITPNAPSSTPHRTASPTWEPTPVGSTDSSSSHHTTGTLFGRAAGNGTATEEPSPSVAVGSGVNPAEPRPSSLGATHHTQGPYYDQSTDQWYEMFPNGSGRTSLPSIATYRPRPMGSSSLPPLFYEHTPDSFSATSASMMNSNYHSGHVNGSQDGTYGHVQHRWSGQFLN